MHQRREQRQEPRHELRHEPAARALRLADPEHGVLDDIVDLDRYPIDRSPIARGHTDRGDARFEALVGSAQAALRHDGCLVLPGFVAPDALARARAELAAIAPLAEIRDWSSSVYARTDFEHDLPPDDPRAINIANRLGHVTRDQIAPTSVLARLYVSPVFKRFVAAVVGEMRVFEYADPLAGLIATIIPPGGSKAWHYDTNDYVVTVMTQAGDRGGEFEYCPNLRTAGDENLAGLRHVLVDEPAEKITRLALRPGDVQIFRGRWSLHRVREVEGATERHVGVLSYADRPGVIGPVDRTRAVYGRVTEAHLVAQEFALTGADGLIA